MSGFRADHVGSLLRPQALLDARAAHERGEITLEALREAEDAAILHVLDLQTEAGVDVLSDGEFRRASWVGPLYEHVQGLVPRPQRPYQAPLWRGPDADDANADLPIPVVAVGERLSMAERMTGHETSFLGRHARRPFKITMPGPSIYMNIYEEGFSNAAYPTRDDYLDALIGIYQAEVEAQVADGAAYVQLDSLRYMQVFANMIKTMSSVDGEIVFAEALRSDNAVLDRARAKGATTAVHICRGNHRSAWAGAGSYEPVAERLFAELRADRFLLEFDDERSGGFEPLRFMPKGKTVVLGLVTTKRPELEDKDMLRRRVDEAARFVGLETLAISPQCGFASTFKGNLLSEDDERRKLELVAETARSIWG